MKKINGFTLAEVLITLVIIGIIAAMTIPTLMNKTNEQETVVAVKKAYSTLSQAYQRMIAENGEIYPQNLGATQKEASKTLGEIIVPYLSVLKDCGVEISGDCWSTENGGMYKYFNGNDWYNFNQNNYLEYYSVRLNDGSSLLIAGYPEYYDYSDGTSESLKYILGHFSIDVNGNKGPNTCGKDVFQFYFTKYGVFPIGMPDDTTFSLSICRSDGASCTAWVVTKGNMDYLRNDVSW